MNKEKNIPHENNVKERRVFLKKALYTAPVLVPLGTMTRAATSAGSELAPCPPGQHLEGGVCVNN